MKILENTRRWRLTYKGLSANLYSKVRERSRRNDRRDENFTLAEFRAWLNTTNFSRLWERWKCNGYKSAERPSVDRKNCLDGYRFENMQIITSAGNRKKGDKEKIILWGKPVCQINLNDQMVAIYPNIKKAMEITGINRNNISSVLHGIRKTAGNYKWKFY